MSLASLTPVPVAQPSFGLKGGLVWHAIAATGEGAMYEPQEPTGAAA